LVSVGVRRTSIGLSAAVRSFLVEFDCWFGESPTDSPAGKSVGLTSPTNMHRKVTGKSPDNSSHSRAKNLAFWIGRVRRSPTGVRPEKGGECKDLDSPRCRWVYLACPRCNGLPVGLTSLVWVEEREGWEKQVTKGGGEGEG